ncbi:FitA-like ribbon-helix-helix domain-containing protein [Marinobacter psychrophilus]|jgi:plasmid stability protein|uniref:FitA-like ribbon-helix-helix domain-containing protein n=1 Tax=Marinobacter psychrophilus TaxID=330734 RepID=UPI001B46A1C8|nr:Arc family DNA-binding protein [Marinobacter psychrophilus]MBQ0762089.1 Arc family DNA-binding protein [Marinobacter psychrophilus]MBQ0843663.1 Arc family DNA-binding protein [Marinobacter psychrophilus]
MSMLTVRNLPDEVHRALRVKAAVNGRSMEAEARAILKNAVLADGLSQPAQTITSEMGKVQ